MVYFLYSGDQIKEKNKILANRNKQFVPGTVSVENKRCKFTHISQTPEIPRFIDAKIVASFESLDKATYISPSITSLKGVF